MKSRHLIPGDGVCYQYAYRGEVNRCTPARVVHADASWHVLWWPTGCQYRVLDGDTAEIVRSLRDGRGRLVNRRWRGEGAVIVIPTSQCFAFWPRHAVTGELADVYVNLQAPVRARDSTVLVTLDWFVDLVLDSSLRNCEWKDLDHFECAIKEGLCTRGELSALVSIGADAMQFAAAHSDEIWRWGAWQPPRGWREAELSCNSTRDINCYACARIPSAVPLPRNVTGFLEGLNGTEPANGGVT